MSKKSIIFSALFILTVILGIAFSANAEFAELYTLFISPIIRLPISFISSLFPFSLGESLVLITALMTAAAAISGIRLLIIKALKLKGQSNFKNYCKIIGCILAFVYFTYTLTFQSSYSRVPISETLGIKAVDMTAENVFSAIENAASELKKLDGEIYYRTGEPTRSDMAFDEMSEEVLECAKSAAKKYPIFQRLVIRAKPIAFSEPMSYTAISGVYTFFTGESNVNTSFSEYTLPFTAAHEYSHQMGIGSEKEAEFSAMLICLESDKAYVKYSAYSQVIITLLNTLYDIDENAFYDAFSMLPTYLIGDMYASSASSAKYSETKADEIASAVNDTYLSLSGDGGVVSYSLSAQLYTAYFSSKE